MPKSKWTVKIISFRLALILGQVHAETLVTKTAAQQQGASIISETHPAGVNRSTCGSRIPVSRQRHRGNFKAEVRSAVNKSRKPRDPRQQLEVVSLTGLASEYYYCLLNWPWLCKEES